MSCQILQFNVLYFMPKLPKFFSLQIIHSLLDLRNPQFQPTLTPQVIHFNSLSPLESPKSSISMLFNPFLTCQIFFFFTLSPFDSPHPQFRFSFSAPHLTKTSIPILFLCSSTYQILHFDPLSPLVDQVSVALLLPPHIVEFLASIALLLLPELVRLLVSWSELVELLRPVDPRRFSFDCCNRSSRSLILAASEIQTTKQI